MKRDYKLYIGDIKECIVKIEKYLEGISEEEFNENEQIQDAVIRRLEIIGEASRNIPRVLKEKNNHIPWKTMIDYRDFIVHTYFGASLRRIWIISTQDLKKLKEDMKHITLV